MDFSRSKLTPIEQRKLKYLARDADFVVLLRTIMALPPAVWPRVTVACQPVEGPRRATERAAA